VALRGYGVWLGAWKLEQLNNVAVAGSSQNRKGRRLNKNVPKFGQQPPDPEGRARSISLCAVLAASLTLRLSLFDFQSGDFRGCLSSWYDFFVEHGRWHGLALREPSATYAPLYLYFISLSTLLPLPKLYAIKLFSVAADYLGAWYFWRLAGLRFGTGRMRLAAMAALLFLPTVVTNSALWGQCDMMYTAGFVASLFYLLEGRPAAALAAFGFSCALKPQAVFWGPLLAALLLSRRLPWRWLWVSPAVYVGCALPAILAGRPLAQALWPIGQADMTPDLVLGATNWYQWISARYSDTLWTVGIALALLAAEVFALWARRGPARGNSESRLSAALCRDAATRRRGPDEGNSESRWLVSLALLSVLFPPFLMPGMHERYFFPADVLSLVYALWMPGGLWVAAMAQIASVFSYFPYLYSQEPVPGSLLALLIVSAIAWVLEDLAQLARAKPQCV
jgi:Gpi18-like mannosyltransferase